jgi:anti-sigma-K factor RskA
MNGDDETTSDELGELSAGSALHALTPEEQAAFDAARADVQLDALARRDEDTAARLADLAPEVTPPAWVRDALLARITESAPDVLPQATPDIVAPETAQTPAPRRRLWFALAASIALVAALGVGAATLGPVLLRPAATVAIEQITTAPDAGQAATDLEGGGTASVVWSASEGLSAFTAEGLGELPADRTYELWYVRGEGAVSAGTFRPTADGSAEAVLTGDYRAGDVVAVTIEPDGGAPDGQPTSEPVIVIPT